VRRMMAASASIVSNGAILRRVAAISSPLRILAGRLQDLGNTHQPIPAFRA
jgi:hypothetical protein